jgi:hypothetical protein
MCAGLLRVGRLEQVEANGHRGGLDVQKTLLFVRPVTFPQERTVNMKCDLCSESLGAQGYLRVSNVVDNETKSWAFCHNCLYLRNPNADQKQRVDELLKEMLGLRDGVDSVARH